MDPARPHRPEQLFEHAEFLSRLARGLIGDEHRAADLVQDTWVAALEHPPRDASALGGWLGRVLHNRAITVGRGDARRSEREERSARPERQESPDDALARMEIQKLVFDGVLALPGAQRTALYLRYYEGLTPVAIAERIGAPVKTVKTRLSRGLTALRERLDARAEGGRKAWLAALAPIAFPPPGTGAPAGPGAAAGAEILGGLAMKKALLACAVLVAAALIWNGLRGGAGPSATVAAPSDVELVSPVEEPPPGRAAVLDEPGRASPREDALSQSEAVELPELASLRLRLSWDDGDPARDLVAMVDCKEDPSSRREFFRARSDDAGIARFGALFPGEVRVVLDRGHRYVYDIAAGESREVDLRLPRGEQVAGRVLDPDGNPVAGAEIWLEGLHFGWPAATRAAISGEDGSFRLRGLGEEARFGARARGWQPSLLFRVPGLPVNGEGERTVDLRLAPAGGRVAGRVLDPEGNPLAGALVHGGPRGGFIVDMASGLRGEAATPVPVETDAEGRFELAGDLPAGNQPIHAMARGFPVWSGSVHVPEAGKVEFDVHLSRGASIEGVVLDSRGKPVPDASVVCAVEVNGGWYRHAFPPPRADTDEEGRFRLNDVPAGNPQLNAHPHYTKPRMGKAQLHVPCEEGSVARCELRLDPDPSIRGRVVGPDGFPLAGWRVRGEPAGIHFGRVYPRSDKTDEGGRFVLANVGDCPHEVFVSAPGETMTRRAEARARPGDHDVVLQVDQVGIGRGWVRGVLQDVDGSVPPDAGLSIWDVTGNVGLFVDLDPGTGAFEHEVPEGTHVLRAARGRKTLIVTDPFRVGPDGTTDLGILRIESPGRLEVVVRGLFAPFAGRIDFMLEGPSVGSEDLDFVDGRHVSGDLAPGTWTLSIPDDELYISSREIEIAPGRTEIVEVEVQRAYPLALTLELAEDRWDELTIVVTDETGAEVGRRRVELAVYRERPTTTFRLYVPACRASVEARTDTGLTARTELTVDEGLFTREPVTLRLE